MPTSKPLEKEIQKSICEYLSLKRYFFWRQNVSPTVQKSGDGWQFRRMAAHTMKGTPDIILVTKTGQFVGLEVKRPGGKQSDDQKEFEKRCLKAGGRYHVVTSLEDVRALGF